MNHAEAFNDECGVIYTDEGMKIYRVPKRKKK